MKQVAGSIKLELAQYREMASFAQFASDLDASTQKLLQRGERLTELLKQAQFSPLTMEQQVASIFAGVKGYLDTIPAKAVTRFEHEYLLQLGKNEPKILAAIRDEKQISPETETKLRAFLERFVQDFVS